MATLATSQQWLHQSSLLLEARPQTTRVTCRYSVKPKPARRVKKSEAQPASSSSDADASPAKKARGAATVPAGQQNPRARLVLKTVDAASGVCLKYTTTKAAEVSRLVQMLGQLSRRQAGLLAAVTEQQQEDTTMADADAAAPAAAAAAPAAAAPAPAPAPAAPAPQQGGGGGKGKKKKGKR